MNNKAAIFASLGFEVVGLVGALVYVGHYLDQKYGWGSMGAAAGAFIGFTALFIHLVVVIKELAKRDAASNTDQQ